MTTLGLGPLRVRRAIAAPNADMLAGCSAGSIEDFSPAHSAQFGLASAVGAKAAR